MSCVPLRWAGTSAATRRWPWRAARCGGPACRRRWRSKCAPARRVSGSRQTCRRPAGRTLSPFQRVAAGASASTSSGCPSPAPAATLCRCTLHRDLLAGRRVVRIANRANRFGQPWPGACGWCRPSRPPPPAPNLVGSVLRDAGLPDALVSDRDTRFAGVRWTGLHAAHRSSSAPLPPACPLLGPRPNGSRRGRGHFHGASDAVTEGVRALLQERLKFKMLYSKPHVLVRLVR